MTKTNKKRILQIGNIFIPILLAIILSLLSMGQGNFSNIFQSPGEKSVIDPIGFTFAIWGPIFLFLGIYLIYQARDLFKSAGNKIEMPYVERISVFFILSTIMACLWYIFWVLQIILLSTLSMVLYLVFLVIGYLRLDINRKPRPLKEKIAIVVPWSMYTGWVTTATIVSITTFLESINFNEPTFILTDTNWGVVVLLVALAIYLVVLFTRNDLIYAGVGIWVLLGILLERLTSSILVMEIVLVSILGMIILAIAMIFQLYRRNRD